ncbi:SusE domain-containing protein [Hymenobacter sp. GOD-10R]|uniref:SusE domain-containing protein n=1 Tax=Hymenobacter sp. GOD-10R TaxID=3093922 RepID=UPI002D769C48|nr:SusE domain-containing protein [Hymenobacter sp. GOD-10R]WRQ29907.1 SusE domain-containing protein [Hymenobacter sp. GOD-10R]
MKKFSWPLLLILFVMGLLSGCDKDDDELNETITPVSNLISPATNAFVRLDPPSNAAVTFEWGQARAADGTLVLYEVLFDKEDGDFSKPLYSTTSGSNGLETKLVLTHGDLNKIANLAGIKSSAQGKLKWTVNASKGLNVVTASESRVMTLERPAGFATAPGKLYITGSGTEGGANISQAVPFKSISSGVFEIYTRLTAGDVKLIDQTTGTPTYYYIDGAKLMEGNQGTSPTTTPKVYLIKVDFNNAAASMTEIQSVGLWFAPENKVLVTIPYVGKGIWKIENTPVEFHQESWGRDERYKFLFTQKNAAGTTSKQYFGSTNSDNQRATASSPASYFYLVPGPDVQYDYSFKFQTEVDKKSVDVTVKMQPDGPYTHQITVR